MLPTGGRSGPAPVVCLAESREWRGSQRIVEEGEETDRRMTLTGVAARLALVALFLAIAVPNMPHQKDGPKTALAEFQPFLASVEAGQSKTSEASEKLLQRFIQWRQKSTSTPGP